MTAPGGGFGESAHNYEGHQPPAGDRTPQQPAWEAPWDSPASSPTADYAPPMFPPPGYPAGYPAQYPPPIAPPPGYQQPPGYGAPPPYPPRYPQPPQFGGPPGGFGGPPAGFGAYPAPDYLGGYGQSQPGMNGLAVGSLVSSLTGFLCCIGGIVGIVLGTIALDQVKRTRQDGYALAVAGIVIGVASLIVCLIIGIFALHSH